MKRLLALGFAVLVVSPEARAQRSRSPSEATVFVRIEGSARIEVDRFGEREDLVLERVEIATGSGFLFSPSGYVLTNYHVVSDPERILLARGGARATVNLRVNRIEACFPPDTVKEPALAAACSPATVVAQDEALDLAVLYIGGSNHPYVPLGDSDSAVPGTSVDALGFPFGREVDVGKSEGTEAVAPEVTMSPGSISARRADDEGEPRYLQITNTLNPGNSGGPLVTREGFAVGVVSMKLTEASGIGFAIPSNRVLEFLEQRGLDQFLTARRLRLGAPQEFAAKGLTIRMPEGVTDASPFRSQLEAQSPDAGITLRIDRTPSPWHAKRVEQALLNEQAYEPLVLAPRDVRPAAARSGARLTFGSAEGTDSGSDQDARVDYAILDLGNEKLVARYVGPEEPMALNGSAIRESLQSLRGRPLASGPLVPVERIQWAGAAVPLPPWPAGWVVEPGRPSACPGLPSPAHHASASPIEDFTVVLRASAWVDAGIDPAAASAACSARRGTAGGASYTSRTLWMGVAYTVEGVFVQAGPGKVVQLEAVTTDDRNAYARALLAAWVKLTVETGR